MFGNISTLYLFQKGSRELDFSLRLSPQLQRINLLAYNSDLAFALSSNGCITDYVIILKLQKTMITCLR